MRKHLAALYFIFTLFSCRETEKSTSQINQKLTIVPLKEVVINLGAEFPKINGNPMFLTDKGTPFFFIQSNSGIGKFDLQKGGSAVEHFKPSDVQNYFSTYDQNNTFITPTEGGKYLIYHRDGGDIYVVADGQIESYIKVSRVSEGISFLVSGVYRQMDIKDGVFYGMFGLTETYPRPPFRFTTLNDFILAVDMKTNESEKLFKLPEEYLNQNYNVYDVFVSLVRKEDSNEFIINLPITDELYITRDFKGFRKVTLTPEDGFVGLSNRSGANIPFWKKEYYMSNSFQTAYYDPYRKLIVRHYRKALTEEEYDRVHQQSFKMHDPVHENRLLFATLEGEVLADIDVTDFNYWYIHFAAEGMYILKDKEMVDEDHMTFTLFEIQMDN
jgi:hypothetical protein